MKKISKTYDPGEEPSIYRLWEKSGAFVPRIKKGKKPFVISMPPPNVTDRLHIGHALTATLQDIMIRYYRMKGEPTLWLPGTDHAGIATQNVVEKELAKKGKTKEDLGRQKFVEKIWEWVEEYGDTILSQLKRLGASADWSRQRFTLDRGLSNAVNVAFNRLKRKGLIYRGKYLINWCPRCQTAVADDEVEYKEEKGFLWYIRYPLCGEKGFIEVATTRPETMLGDTAVAVHPQDERYKKLVGKKVELPLTRRKIPIVADRRVDKEFGTGAVKVTPAHDRSDYEMGLKHNLPLILVIGTDGKMTKEAGKGFAGLTIKKARERILKSLKEKHFLVKEKKYLHRVGRCYRCGTAIEPLISKQWFVKMEPLARPAIRAVEQGRIRFVPKRFEKTYFYWLRNIRDWCVSRQLWWGHRIPIPGEKDVLDTWFSSALWPFSTLGWPKKTADFEYFFPTTVMETGYDIIFFWVARMIMMSLVLTGEIPFKVVYLHGLIRDKQGRKMSKSLGNAMDPTVLIERYGADALRMSLVVGNSPGNDLKFSEKKTEGFRNFANKIWNAGRFMTLVVGAKPTGVSREELRKFAGKELVKFERTRAEITKLLENFKFSQAGEKLYEYFWHEFCDQYIETYKPYLAKTGREAKLASALLHFLYSNLLKLMHPFVPFVTEAIWQKLYSQEGLLITQKWPR